MYEPDYQFWMRAEAPEPYVEPEPEQPTYPESVPAPDDPALPDEDRPQAREAR